MQARRPVKAIVLLSAELSNSTAVMALVTVQDYGTHFCPAFFLAGRRACALGAGAFFFSASTLARRASIIFTTRGGGAPRTGSIFSPACFFLRRPISAFSYRSSK